MSPTPRIKRPNIAKGSSERMRRLERRIRQAGKQYRYGGNELSRQNFVDNLVRDGYARGDIEIALKIIETRAGVSRITDMDVVTFITNQLPKIKR